MTSFGGHSLSSDLGTASDHQQQRMYLTSLGGHSGFSDAPPPARPAPVAAHHSEGGGADAQAPPSARQQLPHRLTSLGGAGGSGGFELPLNLVALSRLSTVASSSSLERGSDAGFSASQSEGELSWKDSSGGGAPFTIPVAVAASAASAPAEAVRIEGVPQHDLGVTSSGDGGARGPLGEGEGGRLYRSAVFERSESVISIDLTRPQQQGGEEEEGYEDEPGSPAGRRKMRSMFMAYTGEGGGCLGGGCGVHW